ncbi:MAG: sigma-70 family RNA polymerase sigma factor, partial [Pseudomonadales bacterium]
MPDPNYASVVERAQQGDSSAFAELVSRFQDLAVGTAYGWLGEIESARDVAQEAFLDAHRLLGQLREPSAFPGWFRQIVTKHCDRVTRRNQVKIAPLEFADGAGAVQPGPEALFARDQKREQLRLAVDSLPASERVVVALHYFAEATGSEVSAFLELPESTIKKRLRRARKRLRDDGDKLMQETIDGMRPSKTNTFAREVSFFLALRAGDRPEVQRLLDLQPELVDTLQDWDASLAYDGILPFANKATPLITAIERNDLAMQSLLLGAGADVNGLCGCATGEAPI